MYIVHAERGKAICLGREGENLARQVVFDLYQWQELYGEGVVQLIAQRMGDTQPYPCVVEMDGNHAVWTITNADTARPGNYGKCELSYYIGETLVKSETWPTIVLDAMCEPSEDTPEPYQGWLDKILAAGSYAEAERIKAEQAANNAGQSAQSASGSAGAALLDRQATEKAKGETETARDEAVAAANAAGESAAYSEQSRLASESAQQKTERASAEVEQNKSAVEAAQEVVEQALSDTIAEREAAEDARDDAENSASDAAMSASAASKDAQYIKSVVQKLQDGDMVSGTGLILIDTETAAVFRLQVTGGKLRMTEVSEND